MPSIPEPTPAPDLSQCEREPVHIPGLIQPHGALLALEPAGLTITCVSDNVQTVLGLPPADLLGKSLLAVAGIVGLNALAQSLRLEAVTERGALVLTLANGEKRIANAHRHDGRLIVECESESVDPDFELAYLYNGVRAAIVRLRETSSLEQLCQQASRELRALTGFDRVLAYRFREDWTGEVLAEAGAPGAERYLGLRFPASDIPKQARALYTACRLRSVPTSAYEPSRLVGLRAEEVVDLTHAVLRSTSPVHLQYMRNMGVTASLGISLIHEGRLWGLITCNHESGQRFVPHQARSACALLGEIVSSLIGEKQRLLESEQRVVFLRTQVQLDQFIAQDRDVVRGLTGHVPSLLDVAHASAAAICDEQGIHRVGNAPAELEIAALLQWLEQRGAEPLITDSLPALFPAARAWKDVGCGLLATRVASAGSVVKQPTWLLWFRPEVAQTVAWGGDPNKPVLSSDSSGPLNPRTSFELWKEDVSLQSAPFRAEERAAAQSLASALEHVILDLEVSRQIGKNALLSAESNRQLAVRNSDLRRVLDHVEEGLVTVDAEGRMAAEYSAAFENWFGTVPPHGTFAVFLQPKDAVFAAEFTAAFAELMAGNIALVEALERLPLRLRAGTRAFEASYQPILEGETLVALLIALRDVTARKTAEEALAATAKFVQEIVEHVPVALFAKSADQPMQGQFTLWNKMAEELFGLSSAQALGKTDYELFPKEQADAFRALDELAFVGGRLQVTPEETVSSRHLGLRTLRTTKVPVFAPDGRRAYLLGMSEDITERKEIERALVTARNAAEAATQAKSAFLATMSHEIRTPMNGILGLIDLMAEAPTPGERRRLLRTVRESGNALLRIIDDVLTFSKAEAGRLQLEEVELDLAELLEGMVKTLSPLAVRAKSMLVLELSPSLPLRLKTDPVRLGQVLFNLVSNAIKFTPSSVQRQGEVSVTARAIESPSNVANETSPRDVLLELVVRDNGIGMSAATLAELFQPFMQADSSTTRHYGGTGLGLSIARSIVGLAGGTLSVESTLGRGSTFTVTWRARGAEGPSPNATEPLTGVTAILYGGGRLPEVARGFLEFAGVEVVASELSGLDSQARESRPGPIVHVLSSSQLAKLSEEARERLRRSCLVLLEEPDSVPDDLTSALVTTQPLCRTQFLNAVAVAAGVAGPASRDQFADSEPAACPVQTIDEAEAAGQLILVAEDNAINREVIERQLSRLGYACVVVPDGQSALSTWRERRFGLLLTDCHMPLLNGFALTEQIRLAERASDTHLPILAITANAMAGQGERCIAAGMDGYLTKPMTIEALRRALAEWLPRPREATPTEATPTPSSVHGLATTAPATTAPDEGARGSVNLAELASYVGDDLTTQAEFLRAFLSQSRESVVVISAHLQDDLRRASAEAHKLRASATIVGAQRLVDLCLAVERQMPGEPLTAAIIARDISEEMRQIESGILRLLGTQL